MGRRAVGLTVVAALVSFMSACAGPPPDVSTPTAVPMSDRVQFIAECMSTSGWDVEVGWDGSVQGHYPIAQADAYQSSLGACGQEAYERFPLPVFDEASMKAAYEAELGERDCLTEAGLEIPEPPALQVYLDTFESRRWEAVATITPDIHPELFSNNGAGYRQLLTACPPPTWKE